MGSAIIVARYYDPATGQFLTVDPDVATTLSPYGYVAGNPLNGADPSGDCGGLFGVVCEAWDATAGQVVHNIQNFSTSSHTLGVCMNGGAGGFGVAGSAQFCGVVRFVGVVPVGLGTTETVSGGAGIGLGITGTIDLQVSNASSINSLGKQFASVSAGGGDEIAGQGGFSGGFDSCGRFVGVGNVGVGVGEGVWGEVGPSYTWTQTWLGS